MQQSGRSESNSCLQTVKELSSEPHRCGKSSPHRWIGTALSLRFLRNCRLTARRHHLLRVLHQLHHRSDPLFECFMGMARTTWTGRTTFRTLRSPWMQLTASRELELFLKKLRCGRFGTYIFDFRRELSSRGKCSVLSVQCSVFSEEKMRGCRGKLAVHASPTLAEKPPVASVSPDQLEHA